MNDVWLVRHGETAWSLARQHTGRTDVPLTPHGAKQAEMLGRRLAKKSFAGVLTSPLSRARETCRLAGHLEGARVENDLQEWDYGALEGRTTADIQREMPGWSIWTGPVPGGETLAQVADRADRVLARVAGVEGPVALFAHAHVLRVLTARWLQLPPDAGRLLALDTASLSVLGYEHGCAVVRSWNESHQLVELGG